MPYWVSVSYGWSGVSAGYRLVASPVVYPVYHYSSDVSVFPPGSRVLFFGMQNDRGPGTRRRPHLLAIRFGTSRIALPHPPILVCAPLPPPPTCTYVLDPSPCVPYTHLPPYPPLPPLIPPYTRRNTQNAATAEVMLLKGPPARRLHTKGGAHTRRNTQKAVYGHRRSHVI